MKPGFGDATFFVRVPQLDAATRYYRGGYGDPGRAPAGLNAVDDRDVHVGDRDVHVEDRDVHVGDRDVVGQLRHVAELEVLRCQYSVAVGW